MNLLDFMIETEESYSDHYALLTGTGSGEGESIPRRRLADLHNPLETYNEGQFRERFRFTKQGLHDFMKLIEDGFNTPGRGVCLPALHKVLVFVRFVSSGTFQLLAGELEGIKQPTVCKVIKEVSRIIIQRIHKFVEWPRSTRASEIKEKFYTIAAFPSVIRCIDCTHVLIQSPGGDNAEKFRNRKGKFSLNCQAVCDADLIFTNIYTQWYGSAHDSRIFNNSTLCAYLENQSNYDSFLLGDQGYPLTPFLMTPVRFPSTRQERNYNTSHKKTRLTVERAFGVLKRVFACLKTGLRLKVTTCVNVIPACVCMYNFLRRRGLLEEYDADSYEDIDDDSHPTSNQRRDYARASAVRQQLINMHFDC